MLDFVIIPRAEFGGCMKGRGPGFGIGRTLCREELSGLLESWFSASVYYGDALKEVCATGILEV